jgi:hypothetical protein
MSFLVVKLTFKVLLFSLNGAFFCRSFLSGNFLGRQLFALAAVTVFTIAAVALFALAALIDVANADAQLTQCFLDPCDDFVTVLDDYKNNAGNGCQCGQNT